jgi:tetratricopeptide (TPR) repeat protein
MTESNQPRLYKCRKCGIESTVKEAFLLGKGANADRRALCFECSVKQQGRGLLQMAAVLLGFGLLLTWLSPEGFFGRFYLMLFVSLFLFVPLLLLHELAHAAVASLLGQHVFAIHLGGGTVLTTFRFLGLRWYLHLLPVSAITIVAGPKAPWYRLHKFLIHLAGPGLHAILAGLFSLAWAGAVTRGANPWLVQFLVVNQFLNGLLLLTNLFPHKAAVSSGVAGSDGWAMLKMITAKESEMRLNYVVYYVLEVVDAVDRGNFQAAGVWAEKAFACYPEEPLILNTLGYYYTRIHEYQKAREVFTRLLDSKAPLEENVKYMVLNNVAFTNLMLEEDTLLPQADAYSAEAWKNVPWEPSVMGTRGAVLIALGQHQEGIELLKSAMAKSTDRHGKASDACFIALGEVRRGDLAQARSYLEMARRLDPGCFMIERVSREINPGTPALQPAGD